MKSLINKSPYTALLLVTSALALLVIAPAAAASPTRVPREVVVKYRKGTDVKAHLAALKADGAGMTRDSAGARIRTLRVPGDESVTSTLRRLRDDPSVVWAVPNYTAYAADYIPNDPGQGGPMDWQKLQWDFLADSGVDAPKAWDHLIAAGKPGGRGVKVAILDSGFAYRSRGGFRRSPEFSKKQWMRGYDFVDRDRRPHDENGHGTHVAGVIAARINNRKFLTGLAYGVRLIPVRVLDRSGAGDATTIARAIRYAARRKAQVINMSLQFDPYISLSQIPQVTSAIKFAHRRDVIIVGAAGNFADTPVALPARASDVIAVGATTESRCLAEYSNTGSGLDLVAPGGGDDATIAGDPSCDPNQRRRGVYQLTYRNSFNFRRFRLRSEEGTSVSAPHVTATAALVIASGILGPSPTPDAVEQRLKATAVDLGSPGYDSFYGYGLLNAAAATDPNIP